MKCPVCNALSREHNHECEAEASATLKQRAELIGWNRGEVPNQEQLEREVLRSRKRQAHIALELHQHQSSQHPVAQIAVATTP
jgi:hypothetical protein